MDIKICCIGSVEEARVALAHGAHALGLVAEMPTDSGVIPDPLIREIVAALPPTVRTFLLTSRTEPGAIVEHQRATGANTLQLVDRASAETRAALRRELPGVSLVQVVHVCGRSSLEEAKCAERWADALLLDSGTPDAATRSLGGTGCTHDWQISREIVENARCPVFLAGGLRPDNVGEAIRQVRPSGVDICSGLRPRGSLDERLLSAFVAAVAEATESSRATHEGTA